MEFGEPAELSRYSDWRCCILCRDKRFFSIPQRPDRLWGPPILLFNDDSWYSFLLEAESTPEPLRLEGLGQLKKKIFHRDSNPQPSGLYHSASTNYATAYHIQWVRRVYSQEVRRPGREADHPTTSSAKVKKGETITPLSQKSSRRCA
jgi:hypothetical protein